ncbi:MAG: 4-(cytidine 5'-diphospho)-2-C-methyl-D-erythritol kinase [Deferribacterales bacterium]
MNSITLKSYGKINIFLHVLGKRRDGFHELYTLFTRIDTYDTITVERSDRFRITCSNPEIPTDHKNIISRVHNILRENHRIPQDFSVHIEKRIPDGGGLGGGSSNGAAYLKAVLALTKNDMPIETQTDVMAAVGSDTAFFLYDEPMTGEGRGEKLTPYGKLPEAYVLLVNPDTHVSTAEVFRSGKLTLTDRAEVNKIRHAETFEDYGEILFNGLESAVLPIYPVVAEAKRALLDSGADYALMSGSGATVFGLFRNKTGAENAQINISQKYPRWRCFLTHII